MTRRSLFAVALSIASHAGLIYSLSLVEPSTSRFETVIDPSLVVWLAERVPRPVTDEAVPPAEPIETAPLPEPSTPTTHDERPDDASLSRKEAANDSAEQTSETQQLELEQQQEQQRIDRQRARLQITDLEFARALVIQRAKDALANEPFYHTFSLADLDRRRLFEEPRAGQRTLAPTSGSRAGAQYRTAMGQTVRSVSEDCFQTSGASNPFGLPAGRDIYELPMTNCVKKLPRSDLFENLKPDYSTAAELEQSE